MNTLNLNKYVGFCILLLAPFVLSAQNDVDKELINKQNKASLYVIEGNENLNNEDFIKAEMAYRKAISQQPNKAAATYNLGYGYYKEGNLDESLYRLQQAANDATSKDEKHKAFHNIGNILMKNERCKDAVEAYKNALRNNPNDDETRYNLALAKECAKNEQNAGDKDDENSEDKKDEKDQKDQQQQDQDQKEQEGDENEDQNNQGDQDKKDGDDQEDEDGKPKNDKDQNDKGNQQDKQQEQQKPRPGTLNNQQIRNLLEALNDKESKVQEKINAEKQKGTKVKNEKDW